MTNGMTEEFRFGTFDDSGDKHILMYVGLATRMAEEDPPEILFQFVMEGENTTHIGRMTKSNWISLERVDESKTLSDSIWPTVGDKKDDEEGPIEVISTLYMNQMVVVKFADGHEEPMGIHEWVNWGQENG